MDSKFLARHNINDYSLLLGIATNCQNNLKNKYFYYKDPINKEIGYYFGIIDSLTDFNFKK